jgi:hypothetical protein
MTCSKVLVRRSLRGYIPGEAQIADEIVNEGMHPSWADTRQRAEVVDSSTEHKPIAARLPINNKLAVYQMADVAMCQDPGHTIYLEFDVQAEGSEESKVVRQVNQTFVNSTFAFYLNASLSFDCRQRCMVGGSSTKTLSTS